MKNGFMIMKNLDGGVHFGAPSVNGLKTNKICQTFLILFNVRPSVFAVYSWGLCYKTHYGHKTVTTEKF